MRGSLLPALYVWTAMAAHADAGTATKVLPAEDVGEALECPPCSSLFGRLEDTSDGKRVQDVKVQLRGEPKSGTSFMFTWAREAMTKTCDYLKGFFGQESCRIEMASELPEAPTRLTRQDLVFEPCLGGDDAQCPCHNVDRVSITLSTFRKHLLPVNETCPWSHGVSFPTPNSGCTSVGDRPVENLSDVWACMKEKACEITDDRLQMAIFRDPRPVAVSSYFHRMIYYRKKDGAVDKFVTKMLPTMCHWLTVRHFLFEGILADRSTVFWYEDALEDPLKWHTRWYESVGLLLPAYVIEAVSDAAADVTKVALMPHPGGAAPVLGRSYKDDLREETLAHVDEVLRAWLPPVYLTRLGLKSGPVRDSF